MSNSKSGSRPLREDRSPFRFVRAALDIQTDALAQKLVLMALAIRMSHETETCWPSYRHIEFDTGLSRRAVRLALRHLRDKLRVLTWEKGHSGLYGDPKANVYHFNWAVMADLKAQGARHRETRVVKYPPTTNKPLEGTVGSQEKDRSAEESIERSESEFSEYSESEFSGSPADDRQNEQSNAQSGVSRRVLHDTFSEAPDSAPTYVAPSLQVARRLREMRDQTLDEKAGEFMNAVRQWKELFPVPAFAVLDAIARQCKVEPANWPTDNFKLVCTAEKAEK